MNMKFLRQQLNKNQDEVAKDLQITRTKYARIETGESNPTIETLVKIANYFDTSLDYLCGRKWNNGIGYIPDNRKDLITQLLALPDTEFNEIAIYVKGYIAGKSKQQTINFYTPDEI